MKIPKKNSGRGRFRVDLIKELKSFCENSKNKFPGGRGFGLGSGCGVGVDVNEEE